MMITLIIVGGIILITTVAVIGENLTKIRVGRSGIEGKTIEEYERRMTEMERWLKEQDEKLMRLENDVSFTNKLLEDKAKRQ